MSELEAQLKAQLNSYLQSFETPRTVIHLIGPLATHLPKAWEPSQPIVFVDGGVKHKKAYGFAAGDGDSSAGAALDFLFPRDKDMSDLALVLRVLKNKASKLILTGFTGGRRDHELFNLGEVYHFVLQSSEPVVVTIDSNLVCLSSGKSSFTTHGLFSIASLLPNLIQLTGNCAFKLNDPVQIDPLSSRGLSNMGSGEMSLNSQHPTLLYFEGDFTF